MASGMPHVFEEAFKQKRSVLADKIDVSSKLLNLLYDADVISREHRQDCETKIDYERVDKLMNILVKRPDHCFPSFCDALIKDGQSHVLGLMNPVSPIQHQQQHFGLQPVFNVLNPVPASHQTQFYTAGSYTQYPANPQFMANYTSPLPYGNPGNVPGNQPHIWSSTAAGGVPQTWNTAAYGASVPPAAYQTGSGAASYGGFGGSQQQNGGASVRSTTQPVVQPRAQTTPVAGQVQSNKSSVNQTGQSSTATGGQTSSSDKTAAAAASGNAALSATQFIPTDVNVIPYIELKIIGDRLHSGGFGLIHRATHDKFGAVVFKELATKIINSKNGREMQKEVMAHTLRHTNIVSTIGAVFEPEHYGVVLESAKHGALDAFIENKEVEFIVKMSFVRDIVRGLNYLHAIDPPVVHGYLKTQHVLVADGFVAKLCDFGLSKWQQFATTKTTSQTRRGTVTHIPPENWKDINHKRTVKYDIYGLGILLWELFTEKMSFQQAANISDTVRIAVTEGQRPPLEDIDEVTEQISEDMRSEVKRLISRCWVQEADERPTAGALKDEVEKLTADKDDEIQKAKKKLETEIMTNNAATVTIQEQQQQQQ